MACIKHEDFEDTFIASLAGLSAHGCQTVCQTGWTHVLVRRLYGYSSTMNNFGSLIASICHLPVGDKMRVNPGSSLRCARFPFPLLSSYVFNVVPMMQVICTPQFRKICRKVISDIIQRASRRKHNQELWYGQVTDDRVVAT